MTINAAKSVLKATELSAGVKPDKKLVEKVLNVKAPTCKKDLDHFIGLVNYFGRYIHDFAAVTGPLNELRRKNVPSTWGTSQQDAFDYLKMALCEYPVVQPYDATKVNTYHRRKRKIDLRRAYTGRTPHNVPFKKTNG